MAHWIILFLAYGLEAVYGYPRWLYARVSHPVVWMGTCIAVLEKNFNRPALSEENRRLYGILTMATVLGGTLLASVLLQWSHLLEWLFIASLLATRSLYDHVHAVYKPLYLGNVTEAREQVAKIVGRDTASLDESGIARAAIESLAESVCDGVIAPLFWAACFGLPGIACYKAINTADSMIGHKDERYRAFGWAAARIDDAANYIPARLSGLLIVTAANSHEAWRVMRRDASKHASPNAGWPEAAMAGALRLQLGGPNSYDGQAHEGVYFGDGSRDATATHVREALGLYKKTCIFLGIMLLLAALVKAVAA